MDGKEKRGKRRYRSKKRAAGAARTRKAILEAGRRLFVESGYGGMTMERVAAKAGVALDTVYASVGPKPALAKLLVETAISGTDQAIPAQERDYVLRIRTAQRAREKLAVYTRALRGIHARLAPLVRALRDASAVHPELAQLWLEISNRRRGNMELFAADLIGTGDVRPDLDREELADVLWTTSASELYLLFVQERSWPPERFERWLLATWERLFLATPS